MENWSDFKEGVIYKYTSPSGKVYIGQTINEKSRKNKHKTSVETSSTYFSKAIKKYGWENIKYEVIIKFKPSIDRVKLKRVLNKLEKRYILIFKSNNSKFGYNLNNGGDGNLGYKHTDEARAKISAFPKTDKQREASRQNGSKKETQETKDKKSESMNHTKKKVGEFDLDSGLLLNTYNSISDAARSISTSELFKGTQKTKSSRIGECCKGINKEMYGKSWKFI